MWDGGIVGLLTAASVLLTGYRFGISDQAIDIPVIKLYQNPALFRKDFSLSYFGTSAGTPSVLQPAMAIAGRVVSLEVLFFVVHITALFFTLLAVFSIAKDLFNSRAVGFLAVVFLLVPKMTLASFPTTDNYLVNRGVALPMELWAIFFFLKRRYVLPMALLGVALSFHATSAGIVLIMFVFAHLLDIRNAKQFPFLAGLAVFAGLAVPWVLWQFLWPSSQMPDWTALQGRGDLARVLAIFKWYNRPEQAPLSWGFHYWTYFCSFLVLFLVSLRYPPRRSQNRIIVGFVLAIVLMILAGIVFTDIVAVPQIMQVQLLRSSKFLTIISLTYAAGYIWKLYGGNFQSKVIACGLSAALFFLSYPPQPSWFDQEIARGFFFYGRPLALLLLASLGLAFPVRTALFRAIMAVVVLFSAGSLVALFFPAVPAISSFEMPTWFVVFLGCVVIASILRWTRLLDRVPVLACQPGLVVVASVPLFLGLSWALARNQGLSRIDFPLHSSPWFDVQLWAKHNTAQDDLFVVPPYLEGFKAFSERGIVASWKDGGFSGSLDSRFADEWWGRMSELRCTSGRYRDCQEGYGSLSDAEFLAIAHRYSASYIVTEKTKLLSLPLLYRNHEYAVYGVPHDAASLLQPEAQRSTPEQVR